MNKRILLACSLLLIFCSSEAVALAVVAAWGWAGVVALFREIVKEGNW